MIISYDLIKVSRVSYRSQKFIILSTIGIRKYLNKNLLTLCLSVNVVRSRTSRGVGQGEENKSKNLRLKPEGKGTCRRSRRRWEDNIKKSDTVCQVVESNKVAQFRIQWQAIVHKAINCQWTTVDLVLLQNDVLWRSKNFNSSVTLLTDMRVSIVGAQTD